MNVELNGNIELLFEGKEITYVISAGIDLKKGMKYFMPSFTFIKDHGSNNEECIDAWDAEEYVVETLLNKVVTPWLDHHTIPLPEEFAHLVTITGVKLEDFAGIQELINSAITYNLFEDYFNDLENE